MKFFVELDEEKLRIARELSDAKTLEELLDQALDAFISSAQNKKKSIQGR